MYIYILCIAGWQQMYDTYSTLITNKTKQLPSIVHPSRPSGAEHAGMHCIYSKTMCNITNCNVYTCNHVHCIWENS